MRRRRGRERAALNAEINVVSLIDVMMLLMIIFMITAPLLTGGVDVKLPKANVKASPVDNPIDITITKDGMIVLDDRRVAREELRAALLELATRASGRTILLKGDEGAQYGDVVQVLAVLREVGLPNVSLVAEQQSAP
ncbi:MAG TPA: biopolymer transporter ExbD [Gemmatimonadaceae bacterium]|nr:biopolymer transporter ExbD [Gemmatimonadaceae bacterium]